MDTRTNIVLDDDLVERAMAKAGVTTKKAAVEAALRAYVKAPDWAGLLALSGGDAIADDYDPKQRFGAGPGLRLASEPPPPAYRTRPRAAPATAQDQAADVGDVPPAAGARRSRPAPRGRK